MIPTLQRQHENLTTVANIVDHRKELYQEQDPTVRFDLSKQALKAAMIDISIHVQKMIEIIERLTDLDFIFTVEIQTDMILMSLLESFGLFVSNFLMKRVECMLASL